MAVDCTLVSFLMKYLVSEHTKAFLLTLDCQKVTTLRITDAFLLVLGCSMTNFNDWYTQTPKNHPATRNCLEVEMRKAYEAGAASQAGTLRDKFAGQALAGLCADIPKSAFVTAKISYRMADEMLEARKQK
jgi:hypothetical protein